MVGASGSGKSSLVAAGLIPRLAEVGRGTSWRWHRLTPGEIPTTGDHSAKDPFLALASALKPELEPCGYDLTRIYRHLRSTPNIEPLLDRAFARDRNTELLLFVDQFEELFTQVAPGDQLTFSILLSRLAETSRLRTVITMRADFYQHCLVLPQLTDLVRRYTFPLGPPDATALMQMITGPAALAGLTFDDGLPATILRDTGSEPGSLALMAYALSVLCEECREGRRLTRRAYDAFGGVKGAIGRKADEAFASLSEDSRAALGTVFKELVEVDPETGIPTRRRALRSRFGGSPAAEDLITRFQHQRLLVGDNRELQGAVVEVAHEALLSHWPRLRQWIAERSDDFRRLRHFQIESDEWERLGKPESHLWKHERLADIAGVVARLEPALTDGQREFLRPEAERLFEELEWLETPPPRRATIGERLAEIGDTRPGVGLDDRGLPCLDWLPVPAGRIELAVEGERKKHVSEIQPFEISKYPLTWAQYRVFLDAEDGYRNRRWWKGLAEREKEPGKQWRPLGNHPAENLSWYDAVAYARWLSDRLGENIRLPTEWEWEFAATGGQPEFEYPWGPDWCENRANTYETGIGRTTAVGMFPHGAAPCGALDMGGNVCEWCLNEYENYREPRLSLLRNRVLHGGSWSGYRGLARASHRSRNPTGARFNYSGVRLVRLSRIFK